MRNIIESNKGLLDVYLLIYYYICFILPSGSYISFHWLNFCNKKLNFWLSLLCSRGRDVVAKDTIWRGISSFCCANWPDRSFITVSVKGTDKTFRSLDNWHCDIVKCALYCVFRYSQCETSVTCVQDSTQFLYTRKVAGLHSIEREILSARKTFSSLPPASMLSSEQEWSEPMTLEPHGLNRRDELL